MAFSTNSAEVLQSGHGRRVRGCHVTVCIILAFGGLRPTLQFCLYAQKPSKRFPAIPLRRAQKGANGRVAWPGRAVGAPSIRSGSQHNRTVKAISRRTGPFAVSVLASVADRESQPARPNKPLWPPRGGKPKPACIGWPARVPRRASMIGRGGAMSLSLVDVKPLPESSSTI